MGPVTALLVNQISEQVKLSGPVVWYDPEGEYESSFERIASVLNDKGITVSSYQGSFFALRKQIDPLISGLDVPSAVIYVPKARSESHYALIELESLGVVMRPGEQPPARNTRLSIVARNALGPIVGEDQANQIQRQVEAGKLTIAELDKFGGEGGVGAVTTVVFGTSSSEEKILRFLSSSAYDEALIEKDGLEEFDLILRNRLGFGGAPKQKPAGTRVELTRYVVATDFANSLSGDLPPALEHVATATQDGHVNLVTAIISSWRLRSDLRESYAEAAKTVETDLGIGQIELPLDELLNVDTFLCLEQALQARALGLLDAGNAKQVAQIATDRASHFWSETNGSVQAEWALVHSCALLLIEAERVESKLDPGSLSLDDLVVGYTSGEQPWCLLDTAHRQLERRHHSFDIKLGGRHDAFEKVMAHCRREYMRVLGKLATEYSAAMEATGFTFGTPSQRTIFDTHVVPYLAKCRIAYILVDALRYEMARELLRSLTGDLELELTPAVAIPPTITPVGMAALVLKESATLEVAESAKGRAKVLADGIDIRDRSSRIEFFKNQCGGDVADLKMADLLPTPKKIVRDRIEKAQVFLITSQEIDEMGESGNMQIARTIMDSALQELQRTVRVLVDLGVERVVISADHGHLFGEELADDMKMDPPGGETAELHRRAWIGKGGSKNPSYLRVPLSRFGVKSELDLVTPRGFAIFKSKGTAMAYFHGGLSLQEHIVPVIAIQPTAKTRASGVREISWTLELGSGKISTRFCSVLVFGISESLFDIEPPKVRLEIRARGAVISEAVSASYGFEEATGDVQLRFEEAHAERVDSNVITLMIKQIPSQKTVSLHLMDASTGVELAKLERIDIDISI